MLKISSLKDVTVLSASKPTQTVQQNPTKGPFGTAEPKIGPVNLQAASARESAAVKSEAQKLAGKGVDVSVEAQEIFDALSKT